MIIQILGTGCYNCIKLETLVNEVLSELKISGVQVVRINDEKTIRHHMPLDETPGLVIDGHLISTRTVPERSVLLGWFQGIRQTSG
jgi:hypothetical protein